MKAFKLLMLPNAKLSYPDQVLSVRVTKLRGANVEAKVTRGF